MDVTGLVPSAVVAGPEVAGMAVSVPVPLAVGFSVGVSVGGAGGASVAVGTVNVPEGVMVSVVGVSDVAVAV